MGGAFLGWEGRGISVRENESMRQEEVYGMEASNTGISS